MAMTETKKEKWQMPEWMEKYREQILETGGNEVEDLIDRLRNEKGLSQTNIIVWAMAYAVETQTRLLIRLKKEGLLADTASPNDQTNV